MIRQFDALLIYNLYIVKKKPQKNPKTQTQNKKTQSKTKYIQIHSFALTTESNVCELSEVLAAKI